MSDESSDDNDTEDAKYEVKGVDQDEGNLFGFLTFHEKNDRKLCC
jgi:hypothetical protein